MFDDFATVTAISLLIVISNLGYNKSLFIEVMANSDRIYRAFFVDAIGNIIVAPFLGTVMLTPFIESVAVVVAGAKTGLSALIAGCLYLATSPVIHYVIWFFPKESLNPVLIFGAIYTIRSIQFIDYRRPVLFIPSLLVFKGHFKKF